jgi:glycerol uptake facilitator-like aquaporin
MLGVFINSFGPSLYQSLISGIQGVPLFQVILVLGVILIQLVGGITGAAGVFGALYKVINDANE